MECLSHHEPRGTAALGCPVAAGDCQFSCEEKCLRLKNSPSGLFALCATRGHQAYLVGGCVRDLLLGREPTDYDVATDATPDEVMRIFPETYAVGAQFGVVLVPAERRREPHGRGRHLPQ